MCARRSSAARRELFQLLSSFSASQPLSLLSTANKMHQLDGVSFAHLHITQRRSPHDAAIVLDHDRSRIKLELAQHVEQRRPGCDSLVFAIDYDIHSRILRAASAGSTSSQRARIAATPKAPELLYTRTR